MFYNALPEVSWTLFFFLNLGSEQTENGFIQSAIYMHAILTIQNWLTLEKKHKLF